MIITSPNPLLLTPSTALDGVDRRIVEKLKYEFKRSPTPALGLSAVQIGSPIQMFYVNVPEFPADKADREHLVTGYQDPWEDVVCNPEVIWRDETLVGKPEQCLSMPDINVWVERPWAIEVKYKNLQWEDLHCILTGIHARVFLHEYDHLQGILITNYGAPLREETDRALLTSFRSDEDRGETLADIRIPYRK